jgi:hypothetical protein
MPAKVSYRYRFLVEQFDRNSASAIAMMEPPLYTPHSTKSPLMLAFRMYPTASISPKRRSLEVIVNGLTRLMMSM